MSSNEADEMLALIALMESEDAAGSVRTRLRQLAVDAPDAPALVYQELVAIASEQVSELSTILPARDLYRATALQSFQIHCVADEWKPASIGTEEFRRHVETHSDPDGFLRSVLSNQVVFPARHSWLVESADVEGMTGRELVFALQLDKQAPPFVLCRLTAGRMVQHGVRIRRPTGFDAALGRHTVWSPTGIPGGTEFVDLDIVGTAVEATLWRP